LRDFKDFCGYGGLVRVARSFFAVLRKRSDRGVAIEPRHSSWFTPRADRLLTSFEISSPAATI